MVKFVNKKSTTLQALRDGQILNQHRPYFGMSMIGHNCERYLWYTFRWCYTSYISPRVRRLFDRGHREEESLIHYLEEVGVHTYGAQEEMVDIHGHCKGHNDGRCIGVIEAPKTEHLAEFKTLNDKYFKDLKKQGVRLSKPMHYAQMQAYMHKLNLTRALYVGVNKNNDEIWPERVYYDDEVAKKLFRRAEDIILSEGPPKKRFKPTWYECKWCDAASICHGKDTVDKNCRTCYCGDILPDGKWECSEFDIPLATGQQRIGCGRYEAMDCFIKEGE